MVKMENASFNPNLAPFQYRYVASILEISVTKIIPFDNSFDVNFSLLICPILLSNYARFSGAAILRINRGTAYILRAF